MINGKIQNDALDHAMREFPREACGLILSTVVDGIFYFPCKNIAVKHSEFEIDSHSYADAEDQGEVVGVIHSHTSVGPRPSQADRVACEKSNLPWYIVAVPSGAWDHVEPCGYKAELFGREYSHGILDCYSFVRDWLKENQDIEIPDFDRDWEWWLNGSDLYEENFRKCGFEKVTELEPGDVILMGIRSPVINHAAIYLGDGIIAHHAVNRLSQREVYGGFWEKNTRFFVRYGGKK